MKTQIPQSGRLALFIASLSLVAACHAQSPDAVQSASDPLTYQPAPNVAQDMPPASMMLPAAPNPELTMSPNLAEAVKLIRAGMSEKLLLSFIQNTAGPFSLGAQEIVYLNDLGASETVINAMMEHDRAIGSQRAVATPAAAEPAPATAVVGQPAVVTVNYFYDTLSPYGNWVEVEGYGRCWQPLIVVQQPNWQPYCDRGHWIYTDLGWYWVSDYSWGNWAFHYGRWFRHSQRGWCWTPDTVWAPAWVSWRSSGDYCGWAPLPPAARYRPGIGFTYHDRNVSIGFDFGLEASSYNFVPTRHFNDRRPDRYFAPRHEVTQIFNQTTVNNNFTVSNDRHDRHTVSNRGLAPETVAAATHTEIRPVHVREFGTAPARTPQPAIRPNNMNRNEHSGNQPRLQPTTPLPPNNFNRQSVATPAWPARTPQPTPHVPTAPIVEHSVAPTVPAGANENVFRRQTGNSVVAPNLNTTLKDNNGRTHYNQDASPKTSVPAVPNNDTSRHLPSANASRPPVVIQTPVVQPMPTRSQPSVVAPAAPNYNSHNSDFRQSAPTPMPAPRTSQSSERGTSSPATKDKRDERNQ